MEYGTNTAVYGQISVENDRLLWRYSDLRRPVIFLPGSLEGAFLEYRILVEGCWVETTAVTPKETNEDNAPDRWYKKEPVSYERQRASFNLVDTDRPIICKYCDYAAAFVEIRNVCVHTSLIMVDLRWSIIIETGGRRDSKWHTRKLCPGSTRMCTFLWRFVADKPIALSVLKS